MSTAVRPAASELRRQRLGVQHAVVAALGYGLGGPLSSSLLVAGWAPASVVFFRCLIGATILAVPAYRALRSSGTPLRPHLPRITAYGLIAVVGCQLGYAGALRHLSVSVALLVIYAAPVVVIGYLWVRLGLRPGLHTAVGTVTTLVGLALLLGLTSSAHVSGVGMAWAAVGTVCTATYFLMNARTDSTLPAIVLIAGGLIIGALGLALACAVGLVPWATTAEPAALAARDVPSWLLIVFMGSALTALPYMTGVSAARILGSRVASFIAMSEVLVATVFAWLLLGQVMAPLQALGGAVLLAGVIVVKLERAVREPAPPPIH